jgi:hypothetical protein
MAQNQVVFVPIVSLVTLGPGTFRVHRFTSHAPSANVANMGAPIKAMIELSSDVRPHRAGNGGDADPCERRKGTPPPAAA